MEPRAMVNALPLFTEDDELREKVSLTPDEIASCEADMLGLEESLANCTISEDDDLPEALYKLDQELEKIPAERKLIFLEAAQEKCPDLINDRHKEGFLWTENLDAKLAAERMVKYWEQRFLLFGPIKCFMPMTLRGAMKDDMEGLKALGMHLLPVKDTAGRTLFCIRGPDLSRCDHTSLLRAQWYTAHVGFDNDPEAQKRGAVFLILAEFGVGMNVFNPETRLFMSKVSEFQNVFPGRMRARHIIRPPAPVHYVIRFTMWSMGKHLRQRLHTHVGSNEDVLQSLGCYGLSPNQLPSELGGSIILDLNSWIDGRQKLEGQSSCKPPSISKPKGRLRLEDQSSCRPPSTKCFVGRSGDPRMHRAVAAMLENPDLYAMDALIIGGFQYDGSAGKHDGDTFDSEGVSLQQRKNQLRRRVRLKKKKMGKGGI